MTVEQNLEDKLEEIAILDGRYSTRAYKFIFDSLDFILYRLGKTHKPLGDRHISVEQLLAGIRDYALEHFGSLSRIVFEDWGIYNTADIGEIVFNLVDGGLLNKQDCDMKEDFIDAFSFQTAFEDSFSPEIPWQDND